jgi:ATP-dependent DNA helicase RecG
MIEELLVRNEDKTLEFKENTQSLPGIIKTIIAFANTAGGTIVIGVEDKVKRVVGVANALEEEERLINAISDSIAPFFVPTVEIQTYRKKELILIHVPYSVGPYYLKSAGQERGTYVRFGPTNRVADAETIATFKSIAKNVFFDELPYMQGNPDMLDCEAIKKAFQQAGKSITHNKALSLGLLVNQSGRECPSFGGILLFGIDRLSVLPDSVIRCARFIGSTRAKILDHTDISSHLPQAVDDVIHFIEKNTSKRAEIGRIERIDIPQYPMEAVREAVINALIHTDYTIKGASIMIAIFDDRLEITNPGGIPFGITLAHVLAGSSRVRNRVIARTFRELKIIEQWGSGLQRIINACIERGLKAPLFEEMGNQFRVTLYATKAHKIILDPWQKEFLAYLKEKEEISTKEAAAFWKIAPRNARI